MDYASRSLELHEKYHGTMETAARVRIENRDDLATVYTPGVGAVSKRISENPQDVWKYTNRGNTVAIVSDGTAILGFGSLGAEAALPVMTGKALLFKTLANVDAIPLVLQTESSADVINTVRALAPSFGGINLEDIAAPACFEIEAALQDLGIPVLHDDQHGTAVVVTAALRNALRVVNKPLSGIRVVINGAGAAGTAIAKMLLSATNDSIEVLVLDSKGILHPDREDLTESKRELATITNHMGVAGSLTEAARDADVLIGVSRADAFSAMHIRSMSISPIVFALANPVPEIYPDEARSAGATVVATGRSDFPNQVNNSLAFPGIFRGALDSGATRITHTMLVAASEALASLIENPSAEHILPDPLDLEVARVIGNAVAAAARNEGVTRI